MYLVHDVGVGLEGKPPLPHGDWRAGGREGGEIGVRWRSGSLVGDGGGDFARLRPMCLRCGAANRAFLFVYASVASLFQFPNAL